MMNHVNDHTDILKTHYNAGNEMRFTPKNDIRQAMAEVELDAFGGKLHPNLIKRKINGRRLALRGKTDRSCMRVSAE